MTTTANLTPSEQQSILVEDIADTFAAGASYIQGSIDASQFVFFGAFDGTGNTLDNNAPKGNDYPSNVSTLWKQYRTMMGPDAPNLQGNYYKGPGTDGSTPGSSFAPSQVTAEAEKTATEAYNDFADQADTYLQKHSTIVPQIVVASFSRGDGALSFFSQLLYEKGLVKKDGTIVIPPGVLGINAGVLYDPVTTGTFGNLAQAPTSKDVLDIYAGAEYRSQFKGTNYSSEQFVQEFSVIGNHSDIGGGYGPAKAADGTTVASNGISTLTFEAADQYLAGSGLTGIDEVPSDPGNGVLAQVSAANIYIHDEDTLKGVLPWPHYAHFDPSAVVPREWNTGAEVQIATQVATPLGEATRFELFTGAIQTTTALAKQGYRVQLDTNVVQLAGVGAPAVQPTQTSVITDYATVVGGYVENDITNVATYNREIDYRGCRGRCEIGTGAGDQRPRVC